MVVNKENMININIEIEKIKIGNLKSLIEYSGYNNDTIPKGFVLDNDIAHGKTKLLQQSTELDNDKISILIQFKKKNTDFNSVFFIRKNERLAEGLRNFIRADFKNAIDEKAELFSGFIEKIRSICEKNCNEIIKHNNIVYELSKARLSSEKYYNHSINTMLYSVGVGHLSDFKFKTEDLIHLSQIGMFHNINALVRIDAVNQNNAKERYFEYITQSAEVAGQFGLNDEVRSGISNVSNYPEVNEFTFKDDIISLYSNIVLVAEQFDQTHFGLFEPKIFSGKALDSLYIRATNKELDKKYVDLLSRCLKLEYLFNFYTALDTLTKRCQHESAVPYPNTGLHGSKTPTLFLCKRNKSCEYSKVSLEGAVTLIKDISLLKGDKQGITYKRCAVLTKTLVDFYNNYYDIIKQQAKQRRQKEK